MESPPSGILLRSSALRLGLRALALRRGLLSPSAGSAAPDVEAVLSLPVLQPLHNTLSKRQLDLVRTCFGADAEMALLKGARDPTLGLSSLLMVSAELVLAPLQAEASALLAARVNRIGGLAVRVLGVFAVAGMLFWALAPNVSSTSLAFHKKVTTSSTIPAFNPDPQYLVDGDRANIGIHTECRPGQFAVIDLEKVVTIHKISVFNRADCCKERAVPLQIQLGTDGRNFVKAGEATTVFDEWDLAVDGKQARYVKLLHPGPECFHLAEVEVH
jgi:hypothetical protein